jgi:murein DD-endopeptidase MepM/ murein hydrolase activator NlpD
VADGTVQLVKWSAILGWVLVQSVWDEIEERAVFIGYCHLKEKPKLKAGTKIKESQTVGLVGNTGAASRGAHLHLTVGDKINSVFIGTVFDPERFIDEREEDDEVL